METYYDKYIVKEPRIEIKSKECYNFITRFFDSYIKYDDFIKREDIFIIVNRNNIGDIVGLSLIRETNTQTTKKVGEKQKDDSEKIVDKNLIYRIVFTIIDENYRKRGYNQDLLNFIYQYAKNKGNVKKIIANIRKSNISSINSFLKNGYKISKKITKPYKNGEKKIRVFKYIK